MILNLIQNLYHFGSLFVHYAPHVLTIFIDNSNHVPSYLTGLILGCFIAGFLIGYVRMAMPGVQCPTCAIRGVEC